MNNLFNIRNKFYDKFSIVLLSLPKCKIAKKAISLELTLRIKNSFRSKLFVTSSDFEV